MLQHRLQAILRSSQLEPRHISNLAWAFAVRKAYHPGLYDALAARTLQLGPEALRTPSPEPAGLVSGQAGPPGGACHASRR